MENTLDLLIVRSNNSCELCTSQESLHEYIVPPKLVSSPENAILICNQCESLLDAKNNESINHFRCLNDSMWSEFDPVKVVVWRILNNLKNEGWPQDLLGMMYLEQDTLDWAKSILQEENTVVHKDVNGNILQAGDNVVLIKDLKVKGSSMVAKQGTAVRRISLDHDNAEYIEGKVNGQHIVIICKYVKKI